MLPWAWSGLKSILKLMISLSVKLSDNLSYLLHSTDSAKISHQVNVPGGMVVDMAPSGGLGGALGASALANLPPPYQPVSIRPLGSSSSLDEPQDYLWLLNCESKKPEPNR